MVVNFIERLQNNVILISLTYGHLRKGLGAVHGLDVIILMSKELLAVLKEHHPAEITTFC